MYDLEDFGRVLQLKGIKTKTRDNPAARQTKDCTNTRLINATTDMRVSVLAVAQKDGAAHLRDGVASTCCCGDAEKSGCPLVSCEILSTENHHLFAPSPVHMTFYNALKPIPVIGYEWKVQN